MVLCYRCHRKQMQHPTVQKVRRNLCRIWIAYTQFTHSFSPLCICVCCSLHLESLFLQIHTNKILLKFSRHSSDVRPLTPTLPKATTALEPSMRDTCLFRGVLPPRVREPTEAGEWSYSYQRSHCPQLDLEQKYPSEPELNCICD